MPYRFILLLLIICLLPGAAKATEPQNHNQTPATFAEVLLQLVAMSEAGNGFDSLGTGQKITAGGHKDVERVSLVLPGADAWQAD